MKTLGLVVIAVMMFFGLFTSNGIGGLFNDVTDLSHDVGPIFDIDWSLFKQVFQPNVTVTSPPVNNYINVPQQPSQASGQDNSEVLKKMGELLESTQRQLTDIRQRLEPTPTPTPSPGLLDFLGDILP